MSSDPAAVTVIVCTRNRPRELERCLVSLDQVALRPQEVIVVNSAGDDEAAQIALRHGARYLETRTPGVSHARNLGLAVAQGEWVAFLDDDSVADSDWLNRLLPPFGQEGVAAVFGKVVSLNEAGSVGEHYQNIAFQRSRLAFLDQTVPDWFWLANTGGIAIGANMALHRSALDRIGGFDERLGRGAIIPGAEEHRVCSRLIELGYSCLYESTAIVRHPSPNEDNSLRNFVVQMIEIAAGYLTLSFLEHPSHRGEMLRHLRNRIFRRASNEPQNAPLVLTGAVKVAAVLRGLRGCWRATLHRQPPRS